MTEHDPATHGLDYYLVGGAVRDLVRGKDPKDRDYVVLDATHDTMCDRGFQRIGTQFPVYLHATTKEEYALARVERKSGAGHTAFDFSTENVTLEQDLSRRDLTMNAMAMAPDGKIIDPFGGQKDLTAGVLRHVGPAFADDPLRVLRVARFAAQMDFQVAPETAALGAKLARSGLTPERVAGELRKALAGDKPSRFFTALDEMDALKRLFPEVAALKGQTQPVKHHAEGDAYVHTMLVLDVSSKDALTRFCALAHDLGKGLTPADLLPKHHGHEEKGAPIAEALARRLKLPNQFIELGAKSARWHGMVHKTDELTPSTFVKLFNENGGITRLADFNMVATVAIADFEGHKSQLRDDYPNLTRNRAKRFLHVMAEIGKVRATDFAKPEEIKAMGPEKVKVRLHERRVHVARAAISGREQASGQSR